MKRTATTRAKPCRHVVDVDPKVRTTATPSAPEMRAWMTLDALVPSSQDVEEKKPPFGKTAYMYPEIKTLHLSLSADRD